MNFVFFSVHFPDFLKDFSHHLHQFGVRVLGIGDTDYHMLNDRLKESLTEYYKVSDLGNYDEVLRAVGYLTHRYGKIDRFESLNEHWLELEARIRTDFNIGGVKLDTVENIKRKSRMKRFFEKSGVRHIPYLDKLTRPRLQQFVKTYGYPIIIKPDKGSGAQMTFKISGDEELDRFLKDGPPDIEFIAEEFIDGIILTYDGLVDRFGNILFESSTLCEESIMDTVNADDHAHYINMPEVPEEVKGAGSRIVDSFDLRERFFHVELFKTKKYDELVALEVNMRPPGAWIPDAINFTHDMDIYREWANMVVNGRIDGPFKGKYYTGYASRKYHKRYLHDHDAILERFNGKVVKHADIASIFSRAMGNYAYQFRSGSLEEVEQMIGFIQQEIHL